MSVAILTEEQLAERWDLDPESVARKRRNGDGPKYLPLTESRTKKTIRYRLVDIEAYEAALVVDPKAKSA